MAEEFIVPSSWIMVHGWQTPKKSKIVHVDAKNILGLRARPQPESTESSATPITMNYEPGTMNHELPPSHSYLKASTGFSLEACQAGAKPETTPVNVEIARATKTRTGEN
jgi:hypothetical protein